MIDTTFQVCMSALLGAFTVLALALCYLALCYVCKAIERVLRGDRHIRVPR